jgi:hypothetical protein
VDIDDLYGAPLDRFVPERTALTKALRKDGRRDEAAEVAALRKPSVAAWAVNQLIRTQGRAVQDLFDAGDALRGAHERVAAGQGDAQALRKATQDERGAVDKLVQAARGLLTSDGDELSVAVIERVAETLSAAALDPEARAQVSEGRLERELRHVGLGFLGDIAAAPAATPKGKAPAPKRTQDEDRKAEALERERAQALKDARATEKDTRREAERAQRAADTAQERRDKAASALEEAEQALADAQAQAQAATAAHDQAAQTLERIQTQ